MRTAIYVSLTLALGMAGTAMAGTAQAKGLWKECHVKAICPGVKSGGGRVMACLNSHQSQLSQSCIGAMQVAQAKWAAKARKRSAPEPAPGPQETAPDAPPATDAPAPDSSGGPAPN